MDGGENEATHLGYKGNWKKKGRENAREGKRVDGLRSGQELHLTGKRGGNFKQGLGEVGTNVRSENKDQDTGKKKG